MTIEFHTYHHIAGHLTTRMTIYPWTYGPIGLPGKGKGGWCKMLCKHGKGAKKEGKKSDGSCGQEEGQKRKEGARRVGTGIMHMLIWGRR